MAEENELKDAVQNEQIDNSQQNTASSSEKTSLKETKKQKTTKKENSNKNEDDSKQQVKQEKKVNKGEPTENVEVASVKPASSKEPLSKEEEVYLRKIGEENYSIKKTSKRYKKATLTNNARALSKVRRLYTAKISHKYYFCPILKVRKLRDRAGDDKRDGAAIFGAAARKTKRLILSLVIAFAILAVIGTGSFVTLMVIQNDTQNAFNPDGFTITNEDRIPGSIDNYWFGNDVYIPIKIQNQTAKKVEVQFAIWLEVIEGSELQEAIRHGLLSTAELKIVYKYDETQWQLNEYNRLVYIGNNGVLKNSSEEIEVIHGFSIELIGDADEAYKWANYSLRLKFVVEYGEITEN